MNPIVKAAAHSRPIQTPLPPLPEPFHLVLHQPEIPPNTGNIARLCVATDSILHLVEPLGFRLTDRALRRAGLDYWEHVRFVLHPSWEHVEQALAGRRFFLFSCGAPRPYTALHYRPGDVLVFGSESRGLNDTLLSRYADHVAAIPMRPGPVRSLNLATAAAIVLYEALRQVQAGTGR